MKIPRTTIALIAVIVVLAGLPSTLGMSASLEETSAPTAVVTQENGNVTVENLTFANLTLRNVTVLNASGETLALRTETVGDAKQSVTLITRRLTNASADKAVVTATMTNVTLQNVTITNETLANNLLGEQAGQNVTDVSVETAVLNNTTVSGFLIETVSVRTVQSVSPQDVSVTNRTVEVSPTGPAALIVGNATVETATVQQLRLVNFQTEAQETTMVTEETATADGETEEVAPEEETTTEEA